MAQASVNDGDAASTASPSQSTCTQSTAFKRNVFATISRWLLTVAWGFEAAVVASLVVLSLVFTCVFLRYDNGTPYGGLTEAMDHGLETPSFAFIIGSLLLFAALYLLAHSVTHVQRRHTLLFLLVFITVVQVIWIAALELTTYRYPDSESLIDGANALINGDVGMYSPDFCQPKDPSDLCRSRPHAVPSPHSYFSYYPFQIGPMLWYALTGSIFGADNILAIQILNAFALTGLVAVLWRFGTFFGLNDFGQSSLAVLLATCVPLMMFAAFVYPNAVGFSITLTGVAIIAQAFRMDRVWTSALALTGGCLICGIGVILKSTFIIIMLAAIIGVMFAALTNRRWWQGIVSLISMGGAYMLTKLPLRIIEHVTHQNFGKGMPMIAWVTLGLNDRPPTTAGWWTGIPLRTFHETNGDYNQQKQIAKQFIAERMHLFMQHPDEAARFFSIKLSSEWAEPSFMTSLYSELGNSAHGFSGLSDWLLHGVGAARLNAYENASQTVLYALAFVGAVAALLAAVRSRNFSLEDSTVFARTFLCMSFLGGFFCYLLWEAKGIYTLPFYLLLFPIASYGMQAIHRLWTAPPTQRGTARKASPCESNAVTQP